MAARTESAAQVFREHISGPIVQGKCIACHVEGGVSGSTRLVFVRASESDHEARKLHAAWASCPIIVRELYLLPESKRRLFAGIDRSVTPPDGANAIRNKLVELYDKLLGVQVTPFSPDVDSAYRLFLEEVERARASRHDPFYWVHENWSCFWGWANDHLYFDGILDDVVVEQEHEDGVPYYDFDDDRVEDFMESVDLSDPHHTAHAWVMVLAYLLADYRFLYL